MEFMDPYHFNETVADEILKKLSIDIEAKEYSETCFSIEHIIRPQKDNPYSEIYQGIIGIRCYGFLLYWLKYEYTCDMEKGKDNCEVKIMQSFPEHLQLFNMDVKNPTCE